MAHRTAPGLVASYRLQLRNGTDLDDARALIPWLGQLGVSHLYLSPLFTAAAGSTHGYDVINPNEVDPVLGGEEAFQDLSTAAANAGMGLILDIVPNHMAFTPDNPHVADLLRHGQASRYAALFDIDWSKGPLHFAILDGAPADLLAAGDIALGGSPNAPALRIYDQDYALRSSDLSDRLARYQDKLTAANLERLLAEQHWRIGHWRDSAGDIGHRRFFNISSLIGLRQEDPEVFDFTHRWIVNQVHAGRIQGLRVDHIDGLARPGAYLRQLRDAVGITPIWVEKIVKAGEAIPMHWPIEGMSGYEFMAPVTQLLTEPDGLEAVKQAAAGCVPEDSGAEILTVRRELLNAMFRPELDRVEGAATEALGGGDAVAIRAAIAQLALHWPVYRGYAADGLPLGPRLIEVLDKARNDRMPSEALPTIFHLLSAPDDPLARNFAARFEQLTGALTAKSEEDTVFFRSIAYLPFCEVGAEPGLLPLSADAFTEIMSARARETPCALNTLSTHDTKRSADARALLIALTYMPDLAARLYRHARAQARDRSVDERWGVYALQSALILHDEPERDDRMAAHIEKAMREAKDLSRHEAPDLGAEAAVRQLGLDLMAGFRDHTLWSEHEALSLAHIHGDLVLAQVVLQLTAPGIPDLYEGTEIVRMALTDPDNRRPIDWADLGDRAFGEAGSLDARKYALTQELLAQRRARPELFTLGDYRLETSPRGWTVHRKWQDQHGAVEISRPRIQMALMTTS